MKVISHVTHAAGASGAVSDPYPRFYGAPIFAPAGVSASASTHDGHLGGSKASFDTLLGKGSGSASKGVTYLAAGYDSIVVKFDKDRADDIVITPQVGVSWASDQAL